MQIELCAETLGACVSARLGGAHRIELCSALSEGGLTPSPAFVSAAAACSQLPIHVMLRPRGGNFTYTPQEFAIMREDLILLRELPIAGVVFGLLHPDNTVDVERTRELVQLSGPHQVTFHRAFDHTPDLPAALEAVISTGAQRLLTSGGQPDVQTGASALAALVKQSAGRVEIAAGGGLILTTAAALVRATGLTSLHGSMRLGREVQVTVPGTNQSMPSPVDPADVRALLHSLAVTV